MRTARRARLVYSALLITLAALVTACSHNPPNTTPQANVAHYGTDLVASVNALQQIVITASDSGQITTNQATPIMNTISGVLNQATNLSSALKIYDTLAPGSGAQRSKASEILQLVNAIGSAVGATVAGQLPSSIASEATKAVANINTTIASIRAAVALNGASS
jgi:hypothetical protein